MPSKIRPGFVAFSAQVPVEEYDTFKTRFDVYGATDWFINAALLAFNDLMQDQPSLEDQVRAAIRKGVRRTLNPKVRP